MKLKPHQIEILKKYNLPLTEHMQEECPFFIRKLLTFAPKYMFISDSMNICQEFGKSAIDAAMRYEYMMRNHINFIDELTQEEKFDIISFYTYRDNENWYCFPPFQKFWINLVDEVMYFYFLNPRHNHFCFIRDEIKYN